MRYTKLIYRKVLKKATWLITIWLILLKNIPCLYSKEKMYPLKHLTSTDITNSITGSIVIVYWKWAYNELVLFDTSFIIIVGYTFGFDEALQSFLIGEKWLPPPGQMPLPVTISPFEKNQVVQRLLNKKMWESKTSYCGCGGKCQYIYIIVSEWFML